MYDKLELKRYIFRSFLKKVLETALIEKLFQGQLICFPYLLTLCFVVIFSIFIMSMFSLYNISSSIKLFK